MHRLAMWMQSVLVPALGPFGLFVVAFLDSSFLSFPEINDLLVVTASIGGTGMAWIAISMATLGSLAGCIVLWWLGRRGGEALLVRRFGQERADRARAAFQRWDILAIAIPAVLPPPMPFKIFVLAAGVFAFPLRRFALTVFFSRGLRYIGWSMLGAVYGERALGLLRAFDTWSEKRLPFILGVVAVLVVVALGLYVRGRRRPAPGTSEAR